MLVKLSGKLHTHVFFGKPLFTILPAPCFPAGVCSPTFTETFHLDCSTVRAVLKFSALAQSPLLVISLPTFSLAGSNIFVQVKEP